MTALRGCKGLPPDRLASVRRGLHAGVGDDETIPLSAGATGRKGGMMAGALS